MDQTPLPPPPHPPLTLDFLQKVIPEDDAWFKVPIWVHSSTGHLMPARTVEMREDTGGNQVIVLSVEPASPGRD